MLSMVNLVCFSVFLDVFFSLRFLVFLFVYDFDPFLKIIFFLLFDYLPVVLYRHYFGFVALIQNPLLDYFLFLRFLIISRPLRWLVVNDTLLRNGLQFPQDFSRTDQLFKCPSAKSLPHLYLTLRLLLFLLIEFFLWVFVFSYFRSPLFGFILSWMLGSPMIMKLLLQSMNWLFETHEVGYWLRLNMIALLSTSSGELAILIFEMKIFDNFIIQRSQFWIGCLCS